MQSKYSIELVNPAGDLLADFSGRAKNRRLTKSRNEADEISWTINLDEFEKYCRDVDIDPKTLLVPGQTEARIKRGKKYLAGGQVAYSRTLLGDHNVIEVKATGFLNLFKDRYTDAEFVAEQATTIGADVINETQALDNGDFGVTIGTLATVGTHDRTYRQTNIKDLLQNLTRVQTAPFDLEFTYDKVFNTYERIGSNRPDIIFEFPGNIKTMEVPNDATAIANEIIVLGSGSGDVAGARVIVGSLSSQANYKLRQKVLTLNSVQEEDTLIDAGDAELAAWAFPFEIPQPILDGNMKPYVTDYGIGDYVMVRVTGHPWLSHINRMMRIEKFDLTVDDNDNEEVRPYLTV